MAALRLLVGRGAVISRVETARSIRAGLHNCFCLRRVGCVLPTTHEPLGFTCSERNSPFSILVARTAYRTRAPGFGGKVTEIQDPYCRTIWKRKVIFPTRNAVEGKRRDVYVRRNAPSLLSLSLSRSYRFLRKSTMIRSDMRE